MKKVDLTKWILVLSVFTAIVFCADYVKKQRIDNIEEHAEEIVQQIDADVLTDDTYEIDDENIHTTINVMDSGYDIFTCNGYGYRYGPSIMYYDDGSMDLWLSSPGNNSTEWDYIRYMHSDDGENWSEQFLWDSQHIIHKSAVKIHIRTNMFEKFSLNHDQTTSQTLY